MGRDELGRGRLARRRDGEEGSTRLWTRRDRVGIGEDAASQSASVIWSKMNPAFRLYSIDYTVLVGLRV